MKTLMFLATFAAFSFSLGDTISPAKDARTHFSAEFYRRAVYDLGKTKDDIVVSPAAAQKFLVGFYKGMSIREADLLLFDIGVKHIDFARLLKETYEESGTYDTGFSRHLRRKQLNELAPLIEKSEVINYFEDDFKNTSSFASVENYIVVPENLNPKPEYQKFAKDYFNIDLVHADTEADHNLLAKFGFRVVKSDKVQLYSNVELNVKLANSQSSNDSNQLLFEGEAKYFEDDDCHYIELDLENGLKLFIAVGNDANEFNHYITQTIGRSVKDFESYYASKWSTEYVRANIPLVHFENANDLSVTFKQVARRGLLGALDTDARLSEGFENWPKNGPNVEYFWQRVALKIDISAAHKINADFPDRAYKTFDAVGKNFFYAIRDETRYYAMGSFIGEK